MKKIFYFLLIFICSSCDIMDKKPLDQLSDSTVWNDKVLIQSYLHNIYKDLNFLYREGPCGGKDIVDPLTYLSDEARAGQENVMSTKWKFGRLDSGGGLLELWCYDLIRKTNEFLEKIEGSTLLNEQDKNLFIGQVRFARAITYFYMVKRYGGIPLILKAQQLSDPKEELYPHRNKEIEVYDFIIKEMDEITDMLPDVYSDFNKSYPTRMAALALKSRAALYAGSIAKYGKYELEGLVGIEKSQADRFWQTSYDASKAIIESHRCELYNAVPDNKAENFRRLFMDESKNNKEVIFSYQLTGVNVGSMYDLHVTPFQYGAGYGGAMSAVYLEMVESFENIDGSSPILDFNELSQHSWDLNELFANKDPRFHASVNYEGAMWKGEPIENWGGIKTETGDFVTTGSSYKGIPVQGRSYTTQGGPGASVTGFGVKKYLDDSFIPILDGQHSKVDFIVFRYGEILLNYAEAAYELGKKDEAKTAINLLRNRAGIPELSTVNMEEIRHERKVELAFETHRWWDLRRWRIAVESITRKFTGIYTYYDYLSKDDEVKKFWIKENVDTEPGYHPEFMEKLYYLPITFNRISNNPNLAPENPGY